MSSFYETDPWVLLKAAASNLSLVRCPYCGHYTLEGWTCPECGGDSGQFRAHDRFPIKRDEPETAREHQ